MRKEKDMKDKNIELVNKMINYMIYKTELHK